MHFHSIPLQQAEDVLRECKERRLGKFQDEDIDEKFQLGRNRLCGQEENEHKERKFQQDEKFQLGGKRLCEQEEERGSEGWMRRWSNELEKKKKGWSQHRNIESVGKKEGWTPTWSQRDKGALGFFLCPVCLASHIVPRFFLKQHFLVICTKPRSAFSLLPRVPSLPLRPLSLVSYQAPLVQQANNQSPYSSKNNNNLSSSPN